MADALPLDLAALPIPRTRLIGRETERVAALGLLLNDAVPLLTLTGAGGVGKTRLALEIAADATGEFADGVIWVDLAPVREPAQVPATVAGSLGIVPLPDQPIIETVTRSLRPRQTLLLLDNCEHLLPGVAEVASVLLAACPAVQILAASRAPLRVRGEQIIPLGPLSVPPRDVDSWRQLAEHDAVRLFVERARAVHPGFALDAVNAATVAALCRTLDGLPLALELAAARSRILSPDALLAQMTDRLHALSDGPRDAPLRQQAIEATIGWSYDLLGDADQALFRRLAVFAGGFTLDGARAVVDEDADQFLSILRGISTLVDQSLVYRMERDGEPRFTMLETIRAFALERLGANGEERLARDRHARFVLHLVTALDAWNCAYLPESQAILDLLEGEFANLHAALAWLRDAGDVPGLLTLAGELIVFWQLRGHLREGRQWLEWGLAQPVETDPGARAGAQLALSSIARVQHDPARALALCEESLGFYRASGDCGRIARAAAHAATVSLDTAPNLTEGFVNEAFAAFAQLAEAEWAIRASEQLRVVRGGMAKNRGELRLADEYLRDVIERQRNAARESGSEQPFACWPLMAWGAVAHAGGDVPVALVRYQASLDHAWRFHEARCCAYALTRVASILAVDGRWRDAAWLLGAAEAYAEKIGLAFANDIWPLTRAFGLPRPWQGDEAYAGQAKAIRAVVLRRSPAPLPPLADPEAAVELWAAGRGVAIEEAVAFALGAERDETAAARSGRTSPIAASRLASHELTPRQQEILAFLCERLTDSEIAARLFISRRTVEGHVAQILDKLGVDNRRAAAAEAARRGLVPSGRVLPRHMIHEIR
jgi:non-specific serine/threonine protein kinase